MMYSIISAANGPNRCYCNSERYLALEMKHVSPTDSYLGHACTMAAKRMPAHGTGWLEKP